MRTQRTRTTIVCIGSRSGERVREPIVDDREARVPRRTHPVDIEPDRGLVEPRPA